jgi:RNA polymerase sigma-70 factor (ECF subfamily)
MGELAIGTMQYDRGRMGVAQHAAASAQAGPSPRSRDQDRPLDLDQIYRAHAPTIIRWVQWLAGPALDADDLAQEVFLNVDRLLPSYREQGQLSAWLYRITFNVVRHHRRKERWRRFFLGSSNELAADVADPERGPAELLEERQASQLVYAALDGLSEKYRTVLILFELEGMTGEQIATLTGTSLGTVWSLLHRGREKFTARVKRLQAAGPRRHTP